MTPITTLRIDPREAVSSLNGTSGKKNYFFVDLRSGADHDGILATGVAVMEESRADRGHRELSEGAEEERGRGGGL